MHTQNVKTAAPESSERWGANPLSFIPSRYEAGVSLREDIYVKQFSVYVTGICEYPEDDSSLGTYTRCNVTLMLGTAATLTEAAALAGDCVLNDKVPYRQDDSYDEELGHDTGAVDFSARRVYVLDRNGNKALGGLVRDKRINWLSPAWGEKIAATETKISLLYIEASQEAGWDNFDTATRLREEARDLSLTLIHRCYWHCDEMVALVSIDLYDLLFDTNPEVAEQLAVQWMEDDDEVRAVWGRNE